MNPVGLDPRIHDFFSFREEHVDGRVKPVKPGHDDMESARIAGDLPALRRDANRRLVWLDPAIHEPSGF